MDVQLSRSILRFADMPIRGKILLCLGLALLPVMLVFGASLWAVNVSRTVNVDVTDHIVPELLAFTDMREKGLRLIDTLDKLAVAAAALHDNPDKLAGTVGRERSALDAAANAFAASHEALVALKKPEGDSENVAIHAKLAAAAQELAAIRERVFTVLSNAPTTDEIIRLRRQFKDHAYRFRTAIDAAVAHERHELTEGSESLTGAIEATLAIMTGGMLLILAAYIFSATHLSRRIVQPLHSLRNAALRLGEGDFAAVPERAGGDEVGELVDSFRSMSVRLREATGKLAKQERMAAIGQVAGMVSHELRNPLATIRNSLEILRQKACATVPGLDRVVNRMDRAIERCDVIVCDLLEFFRERELRRAPVMLDAWLDELLSEHGIPAGVTVQREFGFGDELLIDTNRFRQVLVNLIDNAVQAMTDPGHAGTGASHLTIRTEAGGPHARISVIDTGPGIGPDALAKIFEPLFTTKKHGVGLGLPTVCKLVQQHGGTIDVESKVGVGTTFTIWLPRHAGTAPATVTPAGEARAA